MFWPSWRHHAGRRGDGSHAPARDSSKGPPVARRSSPRRSFVSGYRRCPGAASERPAFARALAEEAFFPPATRGSAKVARREECPFTREPQAGWWGNTVARCATSHGAFPGHRYRRCAGRWFPKAKKGVLSNTLSHVLGREILWCAAAPRCGAQENGDGRGLGESALSLPRRPVSGGVFEKVGGLRAWPSALLPACSAPLHARRPVVDFELSVGARWPPLALSVCPCGVLNGN